MSILKSYPESVFSLQTSDSTCPPSKSGVSPKSDVPHAPTLGLSHSRCYDRMVQSLSSAMFDCTLYLDQDFRIQMVSPQFTELLGFPTESSMSALLFKDIITSDKDKERFESYIESTNGAGFTALMLEVVIGVPAIRTLNARLYVTPTGLPGEYFMGVQASSLAQIVPPCAEPCKIQSPTELSNAQFVNHEPAPSARLDQDDSSLFEHPLSVPGVSYGICPKAPPHVSLVTMFYRALNQDLLGMMERATIDCSIQGAGWITPLFGVADLASIREDLVRLLPHGSQEAFLQAEAVNDLRTMCGYLYSTTVGNLNQLTFAKEGFVSISSAHHLCAATRLVLGKLPDMPATDLLSFFHDWMVGYESLNIYCSSMRAKIALTIITCALRHPALFDTPSETARLREIFSTMISRTDSFGAVDQVRLPAVYAACILWAKLQLDRHRVDEAVQILQGAAQDMDVYCARHPGSRLIQQLKAVACFDRASGAIAADDSPRALVWMSEIDQLLRTASRAVLGDSYSKIRAWLTMLEEKLPMKAIYKPLTAKPSLFEPPLH